MKTYTCRKFTGHWSVGSAAVVYASDHIVATELLNQQLKYRGLPGDALPDDMLEFPVTGRFPEVRVLVDGAY